MLISRIFNLDCYILSFDITDLFFSLGNKLEKALREIGREDVIERCVKDMEVVTDDVEKAVANITLDQSGVDNLSSDLKDSSFNDTFHQHQVMHNI